MCNFHICTSPLFTFLRAGMWTWWVIFNHTDKGKPVEMAEEWGRRIKSHPLPLDSNMRKNVFILFQSRVILTSWGSHTEILTNTLALSTVMSQPLCCVLSYQPWGISRFWYASQRLDHKMASPILWFKQFWFFWVGQEFWISAGQYKGYYIDAGLSPTRNLLESSIHYMILLWNEYLNPSKIPMLKF